MPASAVAVAQLEALRAAAGRAATAALAAANATGATCTALLRAVAATPDVTPGTRRRARALAAAATLSVRVNITMVFSLSAAGTGAAGLAAQLTPARLQTGMAAQLQAGGAMTASWAAANPVVRAVAASAALPSSALVSTEATGRFPAGSGAAGAAGGGGGGLGLGAGAGGGAVVLLLVLVFYRLRTRGYFCGMRCTPLATCCGCCRHSPEVRAMLALSKKKSGASAVIGSGGGGGGFSGGGGVGGGSGGGGLDAEVTFGNPVKSSGGTTPRVIAGATDGKSPAAARRPQVLEKPGRKAFGPSRSGMSDV